MYYGSLQSFEHKFDRLAHQDRFSGTTQEAFLAWQKSARCKLTSLLALDQLEKTDPRPKKVESVLLSEGITREKWVIATEEDVFLPFYLLIPRGADKQTRLCICPAGHQGAGKESVAGNDQKACVRRMIEFYHYDYALSLAKAGYVAVAPDPRGFGERRDEAKQTDKDEDYLTSTCFNIAHMAEPLGFNAVGLLTWDLLRLTDYLLAVGRWNTENLTMVGFSGGGMQTLYDAALDERIKTVMISGYFYGFKDSLLILNGNCSCNYVPNLWRSFDCADIARLIAPRNLVIQSCSDDHLNGGRGMKNVDEQYALLKESYQLFHREKHLYHDVIPGDHHFGIDSMLCDLQRVEER